MPAGHSPRVVSLVPSATETLAEWGLTPIACTRYCERPDLVHVGGTKNPDIDAIIALQPDLVVMDRHENRQPDAEALNAAGVELVVLEVDSYTDISNQMALLASAVGVDATVLAPVTSPVVDLAVFVPIWRRPWMTIGAHTYGSDLLASLGARNVMADAAQDYPEVDLDEVMSRQPDVVLVPSEPYGFSDDHLGELSVVAPCVRVDGQDLFWWGARTPHAHQRLRDVLIAVSHDLQS